MLVPAVSTNAVSEPTMRVGRQRRIDLLQSTEIGSEALVAGLAGPEVEHAEGAQRGDVVGAGLEGGLQVEGGAGDVVELLGLDAGEAEVELGEAGLVAGGVGARELGVHQVDRGEPRAGGHVQADERLAGVAVGGGELEGLAVERAGLGDVEDLGLVELAEAELDKAMLKEAISITKKW